MFSRCQVLKSGSFNENGSDGALRSAMISLSRFLRLASYRRVWSLSRDHFSQVVPEPQNCGAKRLHTFVVTSNDFDRKRFGSVDN